MSKNRSEDKFQVWTAEGKVILEKVVVAKTVISRLKGLMFRKELPETEGLLLKPCNSIHTFFMRIPIDAVFCNDKNKVIQVYRRMSPWKISRIHLDASFVIESSAGIMSSLEPGDYIVIKRPTKM